jgi:hypothetical protein
MDQRCSNKYTHIHCPAFKFTPHCKCWGSKCEFGVLQYLRGKKIANVEKEKNENFTLCLVDVGGVIPCV